MNCKNSPVDCFSRGNALQGRAFPDLSTNLQACAAKTHTFFWWRTFLRKDFSTTCYSLNSLMQRDNHQEEENNKTGTKDGISPPPCGFPSALSFPNSPPLCRLLPPSPQNTLCLLSCNEGSVISVLFYKNYDRTQANQKYITQPKLPLLKKLKRNMRNRENKRKSERNREIVQYKLKKRPITC